MQFKLLGSFSIEHDGEFSDILKSEKGCAILAYLIITKGSQSREKVADLIWDADSTKKVLQNLRQILSSSLRGKVPELHIERKNLIFIPTSDTFVDLYKLEEMLVSDDPDQIDTGLKLYKGRLMADFYLPDAPRFNEWLFHAREQLHRRLSDHFHHLCADYKANQQWPEAIALARHWIGLDSFDESTHRQLIQFLAADGQIEAALKQYALCRELLQDELGVEPEEVTTNLALQIEQMVRPPRGELAAPGPLPHNAYMPLHRNVTFTGRQNELRRLAELLLPSQEVELNLPKGVVISGMWGMGKSQLAAEYAYRYGRYYPGGVFWISFANPENVAEEIASIGGKAGLDLFSSDDIFSLQEKIDYISRVWQEPTPRLLIFDNCEDERLAADWLPVTGGCRVIVTSCYANWSKALPLTILSLEVLERQESIELLQKLKESIREEDANLVAETLGDLPLALHLAGSFLSIYQSLSPHIYLQQLEKQGLLRHQSLQGKHTRYSPTQHQLSVDKTFATGLSKLDLEDRLGWIAYHLLAHAACLSPNDPIPVTLIYDSVARQKEIVASPKTFADSLQRLISLGFLNRLPEAQVSMHQLLSMFMLNRLDSNSLAEIEQAIDATLLETVEKHRKTHGYLVRLPFSTSHLRVSTDRALARMDGIATELASLLSAHFNDIANLSEARTYLHAAQELTRALFGESSLQMASTGSSLGNLLMTMGQYEEAEPYFLQALNIRLRELGEFHFDTANSLNQMGHVRSKLGPYESSVPYFERALAVREALLGMEHPLTTGTLNNLGAVYNFMGNKPKARAYFEQVLAIRERVLGPEHLQTATVLNNLGDLLARTGNEETGQTYLRRSVTIRERHLGIEHPLTLSSKTNFGESLSRLGQFDKAQKQLNDALSASLKKLGERHPLTARIINTLGVLYTRMARFEEAEGQLQHALQIRKAVRGEIHTDTAYTLICLGDLYVQTRTVEEGRTLYKQAERILVEIVEPTSTSLLIAREKLAATAQNELNNLPIEGPGAAGARPV